MSDMLKCYSTPHFIASALAAGVAFGGVARWMMRPPRDNDRGLADPEVRKLMIAERRLDLEARQRRDMDLARARQALECRERAVEIMDVELHERRQALEAARADLVQREERLADAQMGWFEEREEREHAERERAERERAEASPESDETEFMHVTCCDVPRTPTAGLARHLQTQTGDLPYDRVVAVLDADCDIQEAMRLLAQNRASCVRVGQQGVMDVTDATICLLQPQLATVRQPVATALRTCASVGPSLTMQVAVQYLKQGYDYLTVRGRDGGIISQAGVLRWLHRFLETSPEDAAAFANVTAADLGSEPLTCQAHTPARSALRQLLRTRARSLALTHEGSVVGVLSVSDIKCFSQANDVDLEDMAVDFVRASRKLVGSQRPVEDIVRAAPDTPALDVLRLVVTEDVHSVYVMDGPRCTAVVTTTDLLRCLV